MSEAQRQEKTLPARLQAELLEEGGASLGSYVTEGEDRFLIGSSKKADLVVPQGGVSGIHAMLRLTGEGIRLYDLGSETGTFVGGSRIVERELSSGEVFEIGGQRVRVNLLSESAGNFHECSVFWQESCQGTTDRLEILRVEEGLVRDERSLAPSTRLLFGRGRRELLVPGVRNGECFLHRKDSGGQHLVEGRLPPGYVAEIYDGGNEQLRLIEQEGSLFTFGEREKARLVASGGQREILLYWQPQGERAARAAADRDTPLLRKAFAGCLALAALSLAFLSYVAVKPETIEEATMVKSSYERITMGSSAPAQQESAQEPAQGEASAAKSEQQPSKAASISSSLAKMLNKKSAVSAELIQEAISRNGTETTRAAGIKNPGIKSEAIAAGVAGGSVNVNALSSGLASGGGGAGGLRGFGGKGAQVGGGLGGNGFAGKGFNMSLGGDEAEAIGGLDKSLIAAVVQANIGQIKHCYERQLIVDPNIFGKVVAQWTINKDGAVSTSSVKNTTMNNNAVENCIVAKIKAWAFPKPKGGGQVIVSYPFLFKPVN